MTKPLGHFYHIDNYVHHAIRCGNLTKAIDHYLPNFAYEGTMYRALALNKKRFDIPDVRMFLAQLQLYANRHPSTIYYAWSKIIGNRDEGMMSALLSQVNQTSMNTRGIIISQDSIGLDVNKFFENDSYHDSFKTEQEVLAQMNNTVHLCGFWNNDKLYTVEEFKEFIDDIRN